ncbi:DUF1353 domain-containing protein [Citrobacter sp. S-77]|uniref:DUF1353 domain-containing protein n=1 Tax=Citrobacter sp. S-77 TaxID=1080067 RepID=UPI0006934D0F|nr:DUF1353 domain-containing protein [Citrobacter sp. S-77]
MSQYGFFEGEVKTCWLTDITPNRNMEILENFSYNDPDGKNWVTQNGSTINGASIPRVFWSVVGSPYIGNYRRASVIHDIACCLVKTRSERKKADKMFYYACLADKCPPSQARVFYVAVRIGAYVDNIGVYSTDSTFDDDFFKPGLSSVEVKNAQLIGVLKDIGTVAYSMPDNSIPEDLDAIIDPKISVYVKTLNDST